MKKGKQFLLASASELIGESLSVSEWVDIDQEQVNLFGEVTHWEKPGHCDPEYGKTTPYGGTLIHGFHMVALCSYFFESAGLRPEDGDYSLNNSHAGFCISASGNLLRFRDEDPIQFNRHTSLPVLSGYAIERDALSCRRKWKRRWRTFCPSTPDRFRTPSGSPPPTE